MLLAASSLVGLAARMPDDGLLPMLATEKVVTEAGGRNAYRAEGTIPYRGSGKSRYRGPGKSPYRTACRTPYRPHPQFQSCSASASALTASSSSGPSAPMITSSLRPISSDNTAMTSFASATRPPEARAIQDSLWKLQAARTNLVAGRACRPAFRATVSCRSTKTDLLPAQMNL